MCLKNLILQSNNCILIALTKSYEKDFTAYNPISIF